MRALLLVTVAALALAACGNNDQSDNTMNVDESLTAENIVANDVTAIDAVTGDAANMAADVDLNTIDNLDETSANGAAATEPAKSKGAAAAPRKSKADAAPAASSPPASNSATNATD